MFDEQQEDMSRSNQPSLLNMRRLFAAMAIDKGLFRRAKDILADRQLPDEYVAYEFWFNVVLDHWNEQKELPQLDMLRQRLMADMEESVGGEDVHDECSALFGMAKALLASLVDGRLQRNDAILVSTTLDDLQEYLIRVQIKLAVSTADLRLLLKESKEQLISAAATDSDKFDSPFGAKLYMPREGRFIPTGSVIVDSFTGGTGPVSGDVIGHAAPIGSGKTTLACQCAYDVAKMERLRAERDGDSPRWVYVFNYEKMEDPVAHMLTYGSRVEKEAVEEFVYTGKRSQFSTGRNYKEYEKKMFASLIARAQRGDGPYPAAEADRLKTTADQLFTNLMVADFTGGDPAIRKMARGFVPGMLEFIESHQERVGNPGVQAVVVDYAGTCARVHMRTLSRISDHTERALVEDLPMQLKNDIANPLKCFVWVAQQLAADECEKQGGTRPSPTRFKGCRSFAENCDFALTNGTLTVDTKLAIMVQAKVRRGAFHPDMVIQLVGKYSHWVPAGSEFAIESDRVVNARDMSHFAAFDGAINPEF